MKILSIDLVSDVVCPWCAIGFARLREAMSALDGELTFEIRWHPFLLNPDLPAEGRDMVEHLGAKYGKSPAEVQESQQQIVAAAEAHGLHFEHFMARRSWNTFDTHRVLALAREADKDQAFNLALFDAYFGDAKNPTDPELLRSIARSLNMDIDAVDAVLASDRHADEVKAEVAHYQSMGVSAVPSFIVNNQYLIAGAQPPDAMIDGFRQIAAEAAETA